MVVLEGGGMLTNSGNQYLQPDYLSPLPTTVSILTGENVAVLFWFRSLIVFFFVFSIISVGREEESLGSASPDVQSDRRGFSVVETAHFAAGEEQENFFGQC